MSEPRWAAEGADEAVARHVAAVISRRAGAKRIAAPGGRTPQRAFELLAQTPLAWDDVELMPTDDRIVPHDHEASNFGRLAQAFAATGAKTSPLREGLASPHFDLVWLGLGEDGHIASLFPDSGVDWRAPPAVIAVSPNPLPAEAPFARLSLSLAALLNADEIIIAARGAKKRERLEAARAPGCDTPIARLIQAASCPVTIYWSPA